MAEHRIRVTAGRRLDRELSLRVNHRPGLLVLRRASGPGSVPVVPARLCLSAEAAARGMNLALKDFYSFILRRLGYRDLPMYHWTSSPTPTSCARGLRTAKTPKKG